MTLYRKLLALAPLLLFACRDSGLRRIYPYTVLTDDYGILSEEDARLYTLLADTVPFDENREAQATYRWQCFPASKVSAACDDKDLVWDSSRGDYPAMGSVTVRLDSAEHEYVFRHAFDVGSCREWARGLMRLKEGERYACIGGEYGFREVDPKTVHRSYVWVYDKFKTKKGCSSWFEGRCDSDAEIARVKSEDAAIASNVWPSSPNWARSMTPASPDRPK